MFVQGCENVCSGLWKCLFGVVKMFVQGCENRLLQLGNSSRNVLQLAGEFFTRSESTQQNVIIS